MQIILIRSLRNMILLSIMRKSCHQPCVYLERQECSATAALEFKDIDLVTIAERYRRKEVRKEKVLTWIWKDLSRFHAMLLKKRFLIQQIDLKREFWLFKHFSFIFHHLYILPTNILGFVNVHRFFNLLLLFLKYTSLMIEKFPLYLHFYQTAYLFLPRNRKLVPKWK